MRESASVLIVDDDSWGRRAFRHVFERHRYRVLEAEDGAAGLAAATEHQPNVVLLDLRMPGMDGLDVLERLVSDLPNTPVLVVSGMGTMQDVVEALRRGAWDFISKPVVDPEFLVHAVDRALEKAKLMRENREYSESLQQANLRLSTALETLRADEQAARHLQFQLLPEDGLSIGPYSFSRRLFPSHTLSGDFLEYFALGERHAAFYLADVAGHGAASAFITAILTTLVGKHRESFSTRDDTTILEPSRMLARLDAELRAQRLEKHVTMFYGVLDSLTGSLAYANAGAFPFPLLARGSDVIELECPGRPLNLPGNAGFGGGEATFAPGGRLLIASDGVLELAPKQSHRERRAKLARILGESRDVDDVLEALELDEATELSDDIAVLFLRREENHG
jgi:sigma-B regulation protein RsbU (phosphoserine phosphatase)